MGGLGTHGQLNPLDIGLIALQAVGFTIFVVLFGKRAVGRFHAHLKRLPIERGPLIIALGAMLGLATAAAAVGLAPIIGAFLAGMVMAEVGEEYDIRGAAQPIYEFLVPFFFVITGTRLNPAVFLDGSAVGIALVITAIAVITKLLGAGAGAAGLGFRSFAIVGTGMVPRGEVGLIIASLGLSLGVVSPTFFSAVVFMSIVTTLMVPPVLAWIYRRQPHEPAAMPADQKRQTAQLLNDDLAAEEEFDERRSA